MASSSQNGFSSDKPTSEDTDVEMTESFEEVPGAKKLASRVEWEKDVFQAADVDEQALLSYLEDLFTRDKKSGISAMRDLREKVERFEKEFNNLAQFDQGSLYDTIQGLQNSDLLSNEKRETLKDFLGNRTYMRHIEDARL